MNDKARQSTTPHWETWLGLKVWDYVLIIVCLLGIAGWYWLQPENKSLATHVLISSGNKPAQKFSLTQDRTVQIQGYLGQSTLKIEHGQVRFVKSVCTNKVCIHSGWQRRSGNLVACLPNRVIVELKGRHVEYDALNF